MQSHNRQNEVLSIDAFHVRNSSDIIGVVTTGAWVPGHPHFLSVMVPGTASKHGHPGCRASGTPTFEILSTPLADIISLEKFK
jgi:hypothetical protein